MIALGEEELKALSTQHFLHHCASGRDRLSEFEATSGGAALKLDCRINILVVEVEDVADCSHGLIGVGTKADSNLMDVLYLHAEDFIGTKEIGDAPEAEIIAETIILVGILIGENGVLAIVGLGLGYFNPHASGLVLCLNCAERHDAEQQHCQLFLHHIYFFNNIIHFAYDVGTYPVYVRFL